MKRFLLFLLLCAPLSAETVEDLVNAVMADEHQLVKRAVRKDPSLATQRGHAGTTLLHLVAGLGDMDLVRFFLDRGADPNVTNKDGDTPLHVACLAGKADVVSSLLKKKADVSIKGVNGQTPLMAAICSKQSPEDRYCVHALLLAGAAVNDTNAQRDTPLHLAAARGKADIVEILLDKGADPNVKGFRDQTPLEVTQDSQVRSLLQKARAFREE